MVIILPKSDKGYFTGRYREISKMEDDAAVEGVLKAIAMIFLVIDVCLIMEVFK